MRMPETISSSAISPSKSQGSVPMPPGNTERIKRITEAVLSLPVLPTVTAKLLELVDNPKTSASILSNLLSKDQVLTAKVLKMANSSFYGFSQEIATVRQAVVVLGYNSLKELCISMSIFNAFKKDKGSEYFDISEFWKHSIAVGLAARQLAARIGAPGSEAFTAGLIHDIGKMVLNEYLPFDFYQVQKLVFEKNIPLAQAEEEVYGVDHGQVGAWLAGRWNLPEQLVRSIQYHHRPWELEKDELLCYIVFLADYLVFNAQLGDSGTRNMAPIPEYFKEKLYEQFHLDDDAFMILQGDIRIEYEEKISDLLADIN